MPAGSLRSSRAVARRRVRASVACAALVVVLPLKAATPDRVRVYEERCAQCHTAGAGGAPRLADTAEWTRRIGPGIERMHRAALDGVPSSAMAAKGGHRDLSEAEVRAAVDWMIERAALPAGVLRAAARYDALAIGSRDFIALDRNLDGVLTPDEVAADTALAAGFARFDLDRDGRLSEAEYLKLEAALASERAARPTDDAALAASARAALAGVRGLSLGGLKIDARAGVVTLIGMVEDGDTARRAGEALRRLPGMKQLDNRLVPGTLLDFD